MTECRNAVLPEEVTATDLGGGWRRYDAPRSRPARAGRTDYAGRSSASPHSRGPRQSRSAEQEARSRVGGGRLRAEAPAGSSRRPTLTPNRSGHGPSDGQADHQQARTTAAATRQADALRRPPSVTPRTASAPRRRDIGPASHRTRPAPLDELRVETDARFEHLPPPSELRRPGRHHRGRVEQAAVSGGAAGPGPAVEEVLAALRAEPWPRESTSSAAGSAQRRGTHNEPA